MTAPGAGRPAAPDRNRLTPADARSLNRAGLAIARAGTQVRELARLVPEGHARRITRLAAYQLAAATEAIRAVAERHPDLTPPEDTDE